METKNNYLETGKKRAIIIICISFVVLVAVFVPVGMKLGRRDNALSHSDVRDNALSHSDVRDNALSHSDVMVNEMSAELNNEAATKSDDSKGTQKEEKKVELKQNISPSKNPEKSKNETATKSHNQNETHSDAKGNIEKENYEHGKEDKNEPKSLSDDLNKDNSTINGTDPAVRMVDNADDNRLYVTAAVSLLIISSVLGSALRYFSA